MQMPSLPSPPGQSEPAHSPSLPVMTGKTPELVEELEDEGLRGIVEVEPPTTVVTVMPFELVVISVVPPTTLMLSVVPPTTVVIVMPFELVVVSVVPPTVMKLLDDDTPEG